MRGGHGQMCRWAGSSIWQSVSGMLTQEPAQHAIHKACRSLVSEAPRQCDSLMHGSPVRHTFHPQALVYAEAQGVTNPWGQRLEWAPTHMAEEPVDSALPAYDAIDTV